MNLHISKTKQEVATDFATFLIDLSTTKDKITVALSGGSTPKIVFDLLAEKHQDIDWSKFYFFWGDERCVSPTDAQSNYKMTVDHLLSKVSVPESNTFRVKGENDPTQEAVAYAQLLKEQLPEVNGIPQFDLVILGMGDDGHTASIFPHEIELWHSKNYCEVATHPDSGQKRVSITGGIINNAQTVTFLVTGASKQEKVKAILKKEDRYLQYPASLVTPISKDLHWFMDEAAIGDIEM